MEQNFINKNQSQEEPQQNPDTNSSTSDVTYNSTQETPSPEQPYYSSQSTDNLQQYPPQPYPAQPYPAQPYPAQPYPAQNMVVPPNQPYYPPPQGVAPIQTGVPNTNYPMQPVVLNVQPVPQNQYYKPYSLVEHKGILQTEPNNFHITTGCCMKSIPYIFFIIGFSIIWCTFLFLPDTLIPFLFGVIFTSCSIVFCCRIYNNTFIILGPNNLTIIRKAICNKKISIYSPGELERVEFKYTKGTGKNNTNNYVFNVVRKDGTVDYILSVGSSSILFTPDEIEYFLFTVNTHIQTKMRV